MKCSVCDGKGILYRNKDFEEPYGYPYRPAQIECYECKGTGEQR
jgi:hypothetical protein